MRKKGTENLILKGDIPKLGGIPLNEYRKIHNWLHRKFGSAYKCEHPNCPSLCVHYEYALKKEFTYKKDRSSFWMLCASCHKKYDWKPEYSQRIREMEYTQERKDKISKGNTGKRRTSEHKAKQSKRMSGKNNPMYGVSISGKNNSWWGKKHSDESKLKMSLSNASITKEQFLIIKEKYKNGEKQKTIANDLGLNKILVWKIIHGKTYKQWQSL